MPIVTDIAPQRRRKTRVNVFLDGEFWCGMHQLCQSELGLHTGDEVSPERVKEMEAHVTQNEAVVYCVDLLSARARTRAQLTAKLDAKGYSEDVVSATVARCEELLLLNDDLYARTLASDKLAAGWGRRRVGQKLSQAGVDRDLCEEVLAEVFVSEDESNYAGLALAQRFRAPLNAVEQRRALAFLIRRGFSTSAARTSVSAIAATDGEGASAGPTEDEAVLLVRRKYPRLDLRSAGDYRRAQNFLLRRGCSFEVVRQTLSLLRT